MPEADSNETQSISATLHHSRLCLYMAHVWEHDVQARRQGVWQQRSSCSICKLLQTLFWLSWKALAELSMPLQAALGSRQLAGVP